MRMEIDTVNNMSNDKTKEALTLSTRLDNICGNWANGASTTVCMAGVQRAVPEVEKLEQARQRDKERIEDLTGLVQELAVFGSHKINCNRLTAVHGADIRDCTCGLVIALSKVKQSGFTPST